MAGDSGAVNKTQLANYLIKYINIFGNTVNIRQEEDKDADGEKKKSLNLNFTDHEDGLIL